RKANGREGQRASGERVSLPSFLEGLQENPARTMRILNVTQSYAPFFEFGGPPVKVRALSEGLAKLGHEVTVLTADWGLQARAGKFAEEWPTEASPFGQRSKVNGVTAIYLA